MKAVQYVVTVTRPDTQEVLTRRLFEDYPAEVSSPRQLAGFLTHKLFSDEERGALANTYFTVTERIGDFVNVFTVKRTVRGTYAHN